jgi:hypothetical protein
MHRSYNIDKRLAPAFTYTPVYKDPKYSFKLQLSFGPFFGAIPELKGTKKLGFQKLFFFKKYILSCRISNPVFSKSMKTMVGSLGSPTVHSYPALLIQGSRYAGYPGSAGQGNYGQWGYPGYPPSSS